jgi:hypothetical protein
VCRLPDGARRLYRHGFPGGDLAEALDRLEGPELRGGLGFPTPFLRGLLLGHDDLGLLLRPRVKLSRPDAGAHLFGAVIIVIVVLGGGGGRGGTRGGVRG